MSEPRSTPWTCESTLREARAAYLQENGWTLEAYDEATTEASFLGFKLRIPNTSKHRAAIRLHDLHHVATGFGTDATGEGEISAWELAGGLRGLDLYVGCIVVAGALFGLAIAPRRTLRAFRAGRRNLFALPDDEAGYESLLDLDVAALRARLEVPARGIAAHRALHAHAPRLTTRDPRTASAARSS